MKATTKTEIKRKRDATAITNPLGDALASMTCIQWTERKKAFRALMQLAEITHEDLRPR